MTQESRLVIVIDSKNAERNTRAVADELANLTAKGGQAESQMTAMSSSIKSLVGYMGGILTINKAIAMADGYTQMAARIRNATQSAEEYALVQDRLLNTANTTYRQLGEAQEVYLSMAGGMKSLGKSTKDTLDLTDSLSFSFTHNATRVDQAQSAMDALSKSMAKGKVDGDAWISIVTGADNVIADMAKQTGKTEAQIRKLGAEGKVSLEDLIKTLIATREQNEKLANNMENSLADGFTKLSNEVTVYLGKANEATSATGMLAGGLSTLADNLDIVANTGAAIGLGYVTTALLTKGAVVKKSIADSIARRAADQAETQSQLQLAAVEVQRARQIEALAIQEVHLARLELNSAITRTERAAATMRLTQAEVALGIASKQTATATAANTVVQNANNAAKRAGILTSTSLIGVLGGPVGLGVVVATVAAGYLLMRNNAEESTKSLRENNIAVGDAVTAYQELNEIQKTSQLAAEKKKLDELKEAYRQAATALDVYASGMSSANEFVTESQVELSKLLSEYKKTGDLEKFTANVQNSAKISQKAKDEMANLASKVDIAGSSAKAQKDFIAQLGGAVKNAGDQAKQSAIEVADLSEKIKELLKSSSQNITDSSITSALASRGYNDTMIELAKKYLAVEGAIVENAQGQRVLRDDLKKMLKAEYDAIMKAKGAVDSRNEAEKERTKELEKQQKVLQASSKVQANAAKYNFGGLESKYSLPNGMLSALHAIETGNTGKTNQVNKQSGATGGFQFLKGTADQYGVKDRTDMAQSAEGAAKYMSYLLKLFKGDLEKAVRAYHAGEGNVQKGKNIGKYNNDYWQKFKGYTAGENGFTGGDVGAKEWEKQLEEATRLLEEQAELRKNLEFNIASEVTRIRSKLSDDLQEIDKAGYSPERAQELKAEYQARADNDIAIAQYALKTKLDDYAAFKKTESELLKDSFDERKFYAARDLELTKDQREKAVKLLDEQLKQEQALLMLARETRLFQYREALMVEAEAVRERYRIEMLELSKIVDIEERRIAMQAKTTAFIRGNLAPVGTPITESDKGKTNTQLLQEETGRELLAMQNRHLAAQVAAKDNANELLRIDKEYLAAKEQLHAEHDIKLVDARQADYESQLQIYSQIAGMTAQVFDQMAGMLRESVGESSALYKTMFLAGRAASIAQAIVNTEEGATKALAQGGAYGSLLAGVVRATGYASVGLIAGQTIAGYKSGGYTGNYGVNQEAGVVHGQEYVLNAAATKRVGVGTLDAINSGKSLGGDVVVQPQITINVPQGFTAEKSEDSNGAVTIDIVRKEINQGVKQAFSNFNNPNSFEAKQVARNFNAPFKR